MSSGSLVQLMLDEMGGEASDADVISYLSGLVTALCSRIEWSRQFIEKVECKCPGGSRDEWTGELLCWRCHALRELTRMVITPGGGRVVISAGVSDEEDEDDNDRAAQHYFDQATGGIDRDTEARR